MISRQIHLKLALQEITRLWRAQFGCFKVSWVLTQDKQCTWIFKFTRHLKFLNAWTKHVKQGYWRKCKIKQQYSKIRSVKNEHACTVDAVFQVLDFTVHQKYSWEALLGQINYSLISDTAESLSQCRPTVPKWKSRNPRQAAGAQWHGYVKTKDLWSSNLLIMKSEPSVQVWGLWISSTQSEVIHCLLKLGLHYAVEELAVLQANSAISLLLC